MPELHSKFSASNFEADTLCPGRRVMGLGLDDKGSKYADEGTAAHQVLEWSIERSQPAVTFLRQRVTVGLKTIEVTADMVEAVQIALDHILRMTAGGLLLSEQRVNYSSYLGVPANDAWGTSDIIALVGDELQVHDYKHGRGVLVEADDNVQMKLYALGALEVLRVMGETPKTARLVIHQPRIREQPSEFVLTIDALESWGHIDARGAVRLQLQAEAESKTETLVAWEKMYLAPNEKSCKFCKAKADCPALRASASEVVFNIGRFEQTPATPDEFEGAQLKTVGQATPIEWLEALVGRADQIEELLAAARAELERRLLAGGASDRFKIVQGKRGNRAWGDADAAEAALKAMRLKVEEMYDLKLISPTTAEKLAKSKVIGPRQWKALQTQITQSDGAMHVAPISDRRPAIALTPPADDFDVVSTPALESEFA